MRTARARRRRRATARRGRPAPAVIAPEPSGDGGRERRGPDRRGRYTPGPARAAIRRARCCPASRPSVNHVGVATAVTNEARPCGPAGEQPDQHGRRGTDESAPAIPRQSRRPSMYAAIPMHQLGLGDRRGEPEREPCDARSAAPPGDVGERQAEHGNAVPLTLEEDQPGPESRQCDERDRDPREPGHRRGPRCGSSREPERERDEEQLEQRPGPPGGPCVEQA